MTPSPQYSYVLFRSVSQTMWADKILKQRSLPHKLIPVPRDISSDCGVCIRIEAGLADAAARELSGVGEFRIVGPERETAAAGSPGAGQNGGGVR